MVEVVCELGINGPRPMRVGNIPQFYLGLLVQQVSCEKVLVDAFLRILTRKHYGIYIKPPD